MISERTNLADFCFEVCSELNRVGTRAVLTGGSAATVYAPNRYQSFDADFVITFGGDTAAKDALISLGFELEGRCYSHPKSRFTLDLPSGPPSIRDEIITDYTVLNKGNRKLYILDQTDCVRD